MVILRQVVLARRGVSKGHHLCGDRAKAMLGKSGRVIIEALLDERGVVTRSVPDRVKGGTVLRTYIVSLAVPLGGVVASRAVVMMLSRLITSGLYTTFTTSVCPVRPVHTSR